MVKYVLITGGGLSGLGKGTVASNLGIILHYSGYEINFLKIDPYFNSDANNLSPIEHGEVYVLDDGFVGDLDFGTYERSLDIALCKHNSINSGKIFKSVIEKEMNRQYNGETVQLVPHISNEIISQIKILTSNIDEDTRDNTIVIIELGGSVDDEESRIFFTSISSFFKKLPKEDYLSIHLSYIALLNNEEKTKIVQNSVNKLLQWNLAADILFCRTEIRMNSKIIEKISQRCNVDSDLIFNFQTRINLNRYPQEMINCNINKLILKKLNLDYHRPCRDFFLKFNNNYADFIDKYELKPPLAKIAILGKYVKNQDAYLSIKNSLNYSQYFWNKKFDVVLIDCELCKNLEDSDCTPNSTTKELKNCVGIIVAGGYGKRGIEDKINVIKFARENSICLLGICLGFQLMCIEAIRFSTQNKEINSQEFAPDNKYNVVVQFNNAFQNLDANYGLRDVHLKENSKIKQYYNNEEVIRQRFRHKYYVSNKYIDLLQKSGIDAVAFDKTSNIVLAIESKSHKFFCGVQYHPEFLTKVWRPSPLFNNFISACIDSVLDVDKENLILQ